jgi:SAM-dependent methyltransferase
MTGLPDWPCPVCGRRDYVAHRVLWPQLVDAWELARHEVDYIDRQQGLCCAHCGNNLRSMALADGLLRALGLEGPLDVAAASREVEGLRLLEVNPAGGLGPWLARFPGHRLIAYPEHDLMRLAFADGSWDVVVHSDTLEHVPDPTAALRECRRILGPGGRCVFTVPIVWERLSRSRAGLSPSWHGNAADVSDDLLVRTEFGADAWATVLRAGFVACTLHCLEFPAGLAIEATTSRAARDASRPPSR